MDSRIISQFQPKLIPDFWHAFLFCLQAAAASNEVLPDVPPADPPQRAHLPALQGQVKVKEPKEAQEEGLTTALVSIKVNCTVFQGVYLKKPVIEQVPKFLNNMNWDVFYVKFPCHNRTVKS